MTRKTQWLGAVSALALIGMTSTPAIAAGTSAGTSITNNVSVSFDVGGVAQTEETASDTFVVDRKIDVNVVWVEDPTAVIVTPGETQAAVAFDVTNSSNDTIDLALTTALTAGTAANIGSITIYGDANGDGSFNAADIAAGAITNLDAVTEDQTVRVFVSSNFTIDAAEGDTFDVALVANAHEDDSTTGSVGTEITDSAGANTAGGVETVLADGDGGTGQEADNDGAFSDIGTYEVDGAVITVNKTSTVIEDPVNGTTNPKAIPGATIEYCITVANAAGAATATGVVVSDDLPADVTFTPNDFGIFVNGDASCASGTDAEGTANASFSAGGGTGGADLITGNLNDIAAGETRSVYFRVEID